jgi:molecular chaperone DnaK (HSP70)
LQAGIKADDMTFVYEPEAAALYCRLQKLHVVNDRDSKGNTALKKGKKVLVFDMGGKDF